MMYLLLAIGALIIAFIITIVVGGVTYLQYKKMVKQKKINKLFDEIMEKAEDNGDDNDGDTDELLSMVDKGHLMLFYVINVL
uniref:Protein Vpu n=1 Tax=Human immunodeficiency virus type 1 TaxID=11676 RepID=A0A0A0UYF8_HV1|nr:vpu protein [Human immunodeficiency virus 1]